MLCNVPHTTCHIHGPLCDLFSRLAEIAHAGACGALLRGALHLRRFPIRRSNAVEVLCRPCAVESTSTRTACVPLWPKPSGLQLRLPHRELRRVRPAASCSACCGPRECVSAAHSEYSQPLSPHCGNHRTHCDFVIHFGAYCGVLTSDRTLHCRCVGRRCRAADS